MKELTALCLSCLFLVFLFPVPVHAGFVTETFKVSHYSFYDHDPAHGEWGKNGASPYINECDYPANYINEGSLSDDSGDYHFEDISLPEIGGRCNITKVVFYMNGSNLGAGGSTGNFNFHFWNGTYDDSVIRDHKFEYTQAEGWKLKSEDITYIWSDGSLTAENFNELYFWLVASTSWISSPVLTLDYVYLEVTYDYGYRWGAFPVRLAMGLIGLLLMILSPTLTVREVYQHKNYDFLVIGIVIFCIGYAFTIAWLVP